MPNLRLVQPYVGGVDRTGQSLDWTNPELYDCPGDAGVANRVVPREALRIPGA